MITTRIGNPEDNRSAIKIAIRAVTAPKLAMIAIAASTESTEQIISAIRSVDTACDLDRVRRFKADYMSACDGHSLERIAKEVLGVEP